MLSQVKTKNSVRKDLFGTQRVTSEAEQESQKINLSPLKSIWGESHGSSSSSSLLLSPALKRSPNRFSTSSRESKNLNSPKRSATPHKLSKYSPFRKKTVYNINPNNTIKKFFPVKERPVYETHNTPSNNVSLGIKPLDNPESQSCIEEFHYSQTDVSNKDSVSQYMCKPSTSTGNTTPCKGETELQPKSISSTPIGMKDGSKTPQSGRKLSPTSKIDYTRDIYGEFLLRIVLNMISNSSIEEGINLLSDEELEHINMFNKFDKPSQRLYGRLLNRKLDWIRTNSMKYGDIILQLILLEQNGFITSGKVVQ